MEWLVLVTRIPVGRIPMAILPYHLEFLRYTARTVCVMDSKSYGSVSLHDIHFEFSRVVSSRLQN